MGGQHLNAAVVGIAPTRNGQGYWLVAGDGGSLRSATPASTVLWAASTSSTRSSPWPRPTTAATGSSPPMVASSASGVRPLRLCWRDSAQRPGDRRGGHAAARVLAGQIGRRRVHLRRCRVPWLRAGSGHHRAATGRRHHLDADGVGVLAGRCGRRRVHVRGRDLPRRTRRGPPGCPGVRHCYVLVRSPRHTVGKVVVLTARDVCSVGRKPGAPPLTACPLKKDSLHSASVQSSSSDAQRLHGPGPC